MSLMLLATSSLSGQSTDWNQWQGPNRDGNWTEKGTLKKFPESGAKFLWKTAVANGYSGPAVAEGKVFVMDFLAKAGDMTPNPGKKSEVTGVERLLCLDAKNGKELWKFQYDCNYKLSYPNGPRATPTVDGKKVYTLGAEGNLNCVSTQNGKVIWSKDLKKEYNIPLAPHWGFSAHPLVFGDMLYCIVGTKDNVVVAFDKLTGKEIWKGLSAKVQGYCPPTIIEAGGKTQLLIWHSDSLNSMNPKTGDLYWTVPLRPAYEMSIIAPIKHKNYLYATALQGTSVLLELEQTKPAVKEVWRGKGIHPDHNPPLIVDDHIYGVDEKGQFRCFDLLTGERKWETFATATKGRPNNSTTGFLVKNNDHFYIATEQGELIIAELSADGFKELDRCKMLEPTSRTSNRKVVWSHPAFAQKSVFARNDKEIVCISLAK